VTRISELGTALAITNSRATRRNIPDDGILHSYHLEDLNSYTALTSWTLAET
jgi:hypothetical protein